SNPRIWRFSESAASISVSEVLALTVSTNSSGSYFRMPAIALTSSTASAATGLPKSRLVPWPTISNDVPRAAASRTASAISASVAGATRWAVTVVENRTRLGQREDVDAAGAMHRRSHRVLGQPQGAAGHRLPFASEHHDILLAVHRIGNGADHHHAADDGLPQHVAVIGVQRAHPP